MTDGNRLREALSELTDSFSRATSPLVRFEILLIFRIICLVYLGAVQCIREY
jgi:hypothetical protein